MDPAALVRTSKFLSLVLRHNPAKIDLNLDEHGWADVDELLLKLKNHGHLLDRAGLEQVVAQNDKKRFAFSPDGKKIRASQGHSISVDLELKPVSPPEQLYHGTAQRFQQAILADGLLPGKRTYVHLSQDIATARTVGRRHGRPFVFQVNTRQMAEDGYLFFLSENGVWLTPAVPPQYLVLLAEGDQE